VRVKSRAGEEESQRENLVSATGSSSDVQRRCVRVEFIAGQETVSYNWSEGTDQHAIFGVEVL